MLAFLVGKWSGDATTRRGSNETVKVKQTEEVQFKLSGPPSVAVRQRRNAFNTLRCSQVSHFWLCW
jgi:hypothetical protein